MATVAKTLPPELRIAAVRSRAEFALLATLFREYQAHIQVDLCFQGFEAELADLSKPYGAPHGAALLAYVADKLAGCVALKRLDADICEMKRLYVRPALQGHGVGRVLATAIIAQARALGYARMRLDTLAQMQSAQALYRSLGFADIAAYNDNPIEQTRFMELCL